MSLNSLDISAMKLAIEYFQGKVDKEKKQSRRFYISVLEDGEIRYSISTDTMDGLGKIESYTAPLELIEALYDTK